jgi:serine/threonine protein kinase
MGAVYAGEHVRVKKSVAIKILHAGASAVEEMADRFEREAQAAGQIGNDHIVEVFDLGATKAGERYMVMEYLEGESFRSRIRRQKRMSFAEAGPLLAQMLEGLEAAHRAGIIHRDLKPDNIFIVRPKHRNAPEFVKILDFGISKFTALGEGSTTRTGTVMGSPNYMSPEHVRSSAEVDARSDLYAVGVMLYEALTGVVPRKAPNFAELLFKIAYEPLPDPRALVPDMPDNVVALINKACATDRNLRFATAAELGSAIESTVMINAPLYLAGPPTAPRAPVSSPGAGDPQTIALTPSSLSLQPSMPTPSQPSSVAGSSVPGFSSSPGFGSQPSFHSYSSLPGGPVGAASFGDPNVANGTAVISLPDRPWESAGASQSAASSSQPSFNPQQAGFGSQPSFQSQPGFQSQPSFQSQPNATSQPSFGSGSQPNASTGSISVGAATAGPMTVSAVDAPRRNTAAIFAIVFAAVLGVGGAILYAMTLKSSASNAASPSSVATAHASATASTTPVATASETPAATTSASAERTAVSAAASISAAPSTKPTVRVGPRPRTPDPGY